MKKQTQTEAEWLESKVQEFLMSWLDKHNGRSCSRYIADNIKSALRRRGWTPPKRKANRK